MSTKRNLLIGSALSGLFAASVCLAADKKDAASPKKDEKKGDAKVAMGECHGVNACKGKGECGGKGHECAGKNECKGKGWLKKSKTDCEKEKGTFKES